MRELAVDEPGRLLSVQQIHVERRTLCLYRDGARRLSRRDARQCVGELAIEGAKGIALVGLEVLDVAVAALDLEDPPLGHVWLTARACDCQTQRSASCCEPQRNGPLPKLHVHGLGTLNLF
jgi:hypothetical protein